jgi:hypothetical protein
MLSSQTDRHGEKQSPGFMFNPQRFRQLEMQV